MSLYHIYTDGACSGNPGPGGWGVVILDEQKKLIAEFSGFNPNTTNNRMEVQAAIEGIGKALEFSPQPKIYLYSDSNYLVQAYTKGWMDSWMRTNWKKGTVKNQDLWIELNSLLRKVSINWVKVKGHSDNVYNNRCDTLAVSAIKDRAPGVPIFEEQDLRTAEENTESQTLAAVNQASTEISPEQVVAPPFDPSILNNPHSAQPTENRCLVGLAELAQNVQKIRQVAEKYGSNHLQPDISPAALQSVKEWVGTATIDHPTIKVHPFFLQVGDLANLWLTANRSNYPSVERVELIKNMCMVIIKDPLTKARALGLDKS